MVRPSYTDKNGIKKGAWSEEEDNRLKAYIQRYGHWNWKLLPHYAGLARCGKSCRLRWVNYLKPGIKHGNFSQEEEDLILNLHKEHGNRWSAIASKLPGRTDNEIKNVWHAKLKKVRENEAVEGETMIKTHIDHCNIINDHVIDENGSANSPSLDHDRSDESSSDSIPKTLHINISTQLSVSDFSPLQQELEPFDHSSYQQAFDLHEYCEIWSLGYSFPNPLTNSSYVLDEAVGLSDGRAHPFSSFESEIEEEPFNYHPFQLFDNGIM